MSFQHLWHRQTIWPASPNKNRKKRAKSVGKAIGLGGSNAIN
jgi:hypothetical protein